MGRFLSQNFAALSPYIPGEQPKGEQRFIKLNTNESPFAPSDAVVEAARTEAGKLNLYSDPDCTLLKKEIAAVYGVQPENVLPVNGSDEILYFAFMALCDDKHPMAFPDISYGFYPIYAKVNRIPAHVIPLKDDFSIDYRDYCGLNENIVIANPNAPTGLSLSLSEIEEILKTNPNNVVIIDEAYVDFGGESCVPLIQKYDNLLVTQTFSKSRSLAGSRLGMGIGSAELIADLNTIKNSVNPYNVNRMTQAAGIAALQTNDYYMKNCQVIMENREYTYQALGELGFFVLPSKSNFLFAKKDGFTGEELTRRLKEKNILVRYLPTPRTLDFVRISIGSREDMEVFVKAMADIVNAKEEN